MRGEIFEPWIVHETLFCQTKTSDSADKRLLFFVYESRFYFSVCSYTEPQSSVSAPTKVWTKKKRFLLMNRLHLFCVAQKKYVTTAVVCWRILQGQTSSTKFFFRCLLSKKNRRFKKTKKSVAKRSDKFFGLFFCYNKVCFCPWIFFTWKKLLFFWKKKKKCKSFPTVEMFYSKSFGKKLKTLRLYAEYYEFCLIWRFFLKGFTFALRNQTFFSSFVFLKDFTLLFPKKTFFFSFFVLKISVFQKTR